MPYLGTFGLEFAKAIVISEISTLEFLKNESLTHTVNFGIGSAFLKVQGPLFLKVLARVRVRVRVRFIKYAHFYILRSTFAKGCARGVPTRKV